MKPKVVYNTMLTILIGCIIGSVFKYIDVFKTENVSIVDLILRGPIVIILAIFSMLSLNFHSKFLSLIPEKTNGSIFSIFIASSFGLLLYLAANFNINSLLTIGFLLLTIKSRFLYSRSLKDNCGEIVKKFFRKYYISYLTVTVITFLLFAPSDLRIFSFEKAFDSVFNPQPPQESQIIINELKKMPNQNNVSIINDNVNALTRRLTSITVALGITYFFALSALILYFIYQFIIPKFFKDNIQKIDDDVVKEELIKKYGLANENERSHNFSSPVAIIKIIRPSVSLISGCSSSAIYYSYTNNLQLSLLILFIVFFSTCFGFVLNDFFDIEKDKIDHSDRVLPRNLMQPQGALKLAITLALVSILISLFSTWYIVTINSITLVLLSIYSTLNNRNGILGNLITAICSSFVILIAKINFQTDLIFMTAIFTFLFILGREIIFDIQDIEGDKFIGKISFPILYSARKANWLAALLFLITSIGILYSSFRFRSMQYFLLVGILSNVLIWAGYIVHISLHNNRSVYWFKILTRFAMIPFILAVIFQ